MKVEQRKPSEDTAVEIPVVTKVTSKPSWSEENDADPKDLSVVESASLQKSAENPEIDSKQSGESPASVERESNNDDETSQGQGLMLLG